MPYYLGYAATPDARILWREISAGEYEHIWACLSRILDPQTGWVKTPGRTAPGDDLAIEFLVYDTFREKG